MKEDIQNRWESYLMYHQKEELKDFWQEFYQRRPDARVLFLLGKGFDPRMNNILKLMLQTINGLHLECITFDFPDVGHNAENQKLYDANAVELEELRKQYGFVISVIPIDASQSWDKRIALMSRKIIDKDLSTFNDIIIDVSALPRAFYFNIAKALFNKLKSDPSKNLFFAVSENVEIDKQIKKNVPNDNIEPLIGFRSMSSRESVLDRINILIPLIGEGEENVSLLDKIYTRFQPSDMFPVLPFPSKDPRRSETLMLEYHSFFTDKRCNQPQNITYADEQNPFELYRIVSQLMDGHQKTLKPICTNVCFGIALLTSKLLSLGALLVGLEHNNCVAIYNTSSTNYSIKNAKSLAQKNKDSEPFLLWITGEAYNEE